MTNQSTFILLKGKTIQVLQINEDGGLCGKIN